MLDSANISKAIDALIKKDPDNGKVSFLKNGDEVASVPTYDVFHILSEYLSEDAKKIFSNGQTVHSLVHQRNERVAVNKKGVIPLDKEADINDFLALVGKLTKTEDLIYNGNYVRVADRVCFFGFTVDTSRLDIAAIRLAAVINDLVSINAVTGVLTEAIMIPMLCSDDNYKTSYHKVIITSYLAIHHKKQDEVEKRYLNDAMFLEGGTPKSI